jgi:class 3 adenylate cyclase
MPDLPSGTVTFLFTDIEGNTTLWERVPVAMPAAGRALALDDIMT